VNNPLQALYAAADLLSLDLEDDESQEALVKEILTNAERVAQMVAEASLLAKSRLPG
jgi:nitrogen-specific signal transduction histidine kinase